MTGILQPVSNMRSMHAKLVNQFGVREYFRMRCFFSFDTTNHPTMFRRPTTESAAKKS